MSFATANVLCWSGHPKLCPSSKTSSKQQEKDEDDILHTEEFTENKELVKNRLVIVHFTERTKNEWIPTGFDENRIFHVEDGKAPPKGTPTLTHLEYRMKKILLGDDFLY